MKLKGLKQSEKIETVIINDRKPSGLDMSGAIATDRDKPDLSKIIREKWT